MICEATFVINSIEIQKQADERHLQIFIFDRSVELVEKENHWYPCLIRFSQSDLVSDRLQMSSHKTRLPMLRTRLRIRLLRGWLIRLLSGWLLKGAILKGASSALSGKHFRLE